VVVVAGGIGLAPLRPVLLHALARRDAFGRVVLLYGARTPGDLLYRDRLAEWGADVTVDAADPGWAGKVGLVTKLVPAAGLDGARTTAFVCGPEAMMAFGVQALLAEGIAPERIHVSLERNMRCGLGHCGHCQLGPTLICRDGPVYPWSVAEPWLEVREL
jgi:NAD(P)H-flavin reductase